MELETPAPTTPTEVATPADALVATPQSGNPLESNNPSSNALADALKAVASGITGQMRPDPTPAPEAPAAPVAEAEPTPAPTGEQPRDEQGRFLPKEEGEATPPAPAEAATEVGAEDDEPDPELVVELMPRWPHEEPVKLAVDSKETAEALRRQLNGALRRDEYEQAMQEVRARAQEVESREAELFVDPLRVVSETLEPEQVETLLLHLLTDDRVYERLADKLPLLMDDLGRRELRLDVRERYAQARSSAAEQLETQRAVKQNLREVTAAIDAIVPEHITGPARDVWMRDARRDLADICRRHNIQLLDPMKVPTALQARLVASGVDPSDAVERIARAVYGRKSGSPTPGTKPGATSAAASPALSAAPQRAATPQPGQRPVSALKVAHQRRAAAGATAGAGVGTPAASELPALPSGGGLSEAFALVRGTGR